MQRIGNKYLYERIWNVDTFKCNSATATYYVEMKRCAFSSEFFFFTFGIVQLCVFTFGIVQLRLFTFGIVQLHVFTFGIVHLHVFTFGIVQLRVFTFGIVQLRVFTFIISLVY